MNAGGFLGALGGAFTGYGEDRTRRLALERQKQLDDLAEKHQGEMLGLSRESGQREQARLDLQTAEQNREPDAQWDELRGQFVNPRSRTVTTPTGLNPRPVPPPPRDPVADHAAERKIDIANPMPQQPPSVQLVTGTDPATGQPTFKTFNPKTSTMGEVGGVSLDPKSAVGASGVQPERKAVAFNQANTAHGDMTHFEQQMLERVRKGQSGIGVIDAMLANKMLKADGAAAVAAERALNQSNPALAKYMRGAKAISVAERLITPRGGSNAMMLADAMLASAGAGADANLIQQAFEFRANLVKGLRAHENEWKQAPQAGGATRGMGGGAPQGTDDFSEQEIGAALAAGVNANDEAALIQFMRRKRGG